MGTHYVAQTGLQLFVSCLSLPNTGITLCLAFNHLIVVLASVGQEISQAMPGEAELCLLMFGASAAVLSCWGLEAYEGFFIHTPSA